MTKRLLVTGGAGFIGSHICDLFCGRGWAVDVIDDLSSGKREHVPPAARLHTLDVRAPEAARLIRESSYDVIVHLAARAGVRPSIEQPTLYQDVNVHGTHVMLEFGRKRRIQQFVFASSSSVYGVNPNVPWSEEDHVLLPISPYASTKVSGELLGHVYSRLFGIRFVGLRFFTVYGPRQRPDLAIHKFARLMCEDKQIPLFGNGGTRRDYTYIADIVAGIRGAVAYTGSDYEIVNLGNNRTVSLRELIDRLENVFAIDANRRWLPEQPGDVPQTWANIEKARRLLGYCPATRFEEGLVNFAAWLAGSMRRTLVPSYHNAGDRRLATIP